MKLCICFWICLSSKWFYLRLFFFWNLGLIIAQQTSIHINRFMAGGWHTSCHPISKMHIVGEGPGETPSALRCCSYLINGFGTDVKQLAKTSRGTLLSLLMSISEAFSIPFYTLIKLCYTKALEWSSLVPGPEVKSSSSEITNPKLFAVSYHYDTITLISHASKVMLQLKLWQFVNCELPDVQA